MNFSLKLETFHAARRLLRAPGFSLSVIALLAASIGGLAAVATAGYTLFAKPLPYQQPDELVTLGVYANKLGFDLALSAALVEELNQDGAFGELGIVDQAFDLPLQVGGHVRAARLDQHALAVLGVRPISGRAFTGADVRPGAEPVALISESLWRKVYSGSADAVGRRLDLQQGGALIIGVVPWFFAMPESGVQVWLPMELGENQLGPQNISQFGNLTVVGRTQNGESPGLMQERLGVRFDQDERMAMITKMLEAEYRVTPIRELWVAGQKEGLSILGIALALVLVASLLNIAGLWLARWFGRGHELAIQSALGGDRRLALIGAALEYALLAVPGLLLALLVAGGAMRMLYALEVVQRSGPLVISLGGSTALIGVILILVSAVPVLIALAWQARGMARTSVRFLTGGGVVARVRGARLRQALMIGQIGIACSLLVVLGLLLSSWVNLMREDLGFARDQLVVAQILSPEPEFPQPDQRVASVAEHIRGLPGVERVSWASIVPFGRMEMLSSISLNSETEDHQVPARPRHIGPDYFSVAGIKLLQGRAFGPEDGAGEVPNVIVDRLFADKYMGGEAMDKQFGQSSGPNSYEQVNIVGVVETVRHMSPGEELSTPTVYSYMPQTLSQVQLLVRSRVPPESLVYPIRSAISGELGEDRAGFITSMDALVRRTVRDREPQLALLATFTGLALVLMFYGLYALQSYQVTARTAEFGMRKAMGATARQMLALVLKSALWLLPLGMALGLAGGLLGARLVAERLYSVSPSNPLLWTAVLVAITLVMIVAVLVPAFRAARITPMEALRYE